MATANDQELLDPFVSITFSEVKIVNSVEKTLNINKAIKAILDQFGPFIPFWASISLGLGTLLDFMSFGLRVFANPLHILLEARDVEGTTHSLSSLISAAATSAISGSQPAREWNWLVSGATRLLS